MFKRAVVAILALAAVVAGGGVAGAATKHKAKNHSFNAAAQITRLTQQGNPPVSGSSNDVGSSSGTFGPGAIVQTTTYGTGGLGKFASTGTAFGQHGTFKYTLAGSGSIDAQGNTQFSGTGKIKRGTDLYKGATGSFTFTGTQAKNSTVATFQIKGKIKY